MNGDVSLNGSHHGDTARPDDEDMFDRVHDETEKESKVTSTGVGHGWCAVEVLGVRCREEDLRDEVEKVEDGQRDEETMEDAVLLLFEENVDADGIEEDTNDADENNNYIHAMIVHAQVGTESVH